MEAEERPSKKRRLTSTESVQTLSSDEPPVKTADQHNSKESHEQDESNLHPIGQQVNDLKDEPQPAEPEKSGPNASDLPPPDATAPMVDSIKDPQPQPPMSKNQQKKLQKKLEWESKRDERKVIRKQKIVARRERKRAARDQALENGDPLPQAPVERKSSTLLPITILIDCDFDDLMRDPERKSLAAQITRSYSDNRKAPFRSHLAICSFGGELKERFDKILTHYKQWKGVKFLDSDFVSAAEQAKTWMSKLSSAGSMAGVFSKHDEADLSALKAEGEVVYLTSESEHTLVELKPFSTYIIGGLVDKNREKGICYKRATQRGIKTARLPIGEFMDMQSRKVLATNHVNEIMVRWLECGDWGEAFMRVIPKRKGGKLKEVGEGAGRGGGDQEVDEDSGDLEDEEEEEAQGGVEVDGEME